MAEIGFKLKRDQLKKGFFDRAKVIGAVDQATGKVLNRFGGLVRKTARRSIRKRKRLSAPGQPPSSHSGELREGIFYAYQPNRRSVVIGPEALNQRPYGHITVPQLLEEGGTVATRTRRGRLKQRTYEPRPYMGPAFEKMNAQNMPDLWKNSVKR